MASTCMHLCAGRTLLRAVAGPWDTAQFYLGCIAPDSVNVDGFASRDVRWEAHLRAADFAGWYENIARFWRANADYPDRGLLAGYAVHCVTDVALDEQFHSRIWDAAEVLALPPMMDKDRGWDDCYRFDHDQFSRPWWTGEVRPALESAQARAIHTIPAQLLERYRIDTLERYPGSIPEGNPRVVMDALVEELGRAVAEKCLNLLGWETRV